MNETNTAIKSLLSDFVNEVAPDPLGNYDYEKLYQIAKLQHIDGIIGYLFYKFNFCDNQEVKSNFLRSYFSAITVNTNQITYFERIKEIFKSNDIDIVAFKGYFVRNLYPVAELRSFSDIDLLIHTYDREKSHSVMIAQGYDNTVDYGNVYGYKKGLEYYELHDSIVSDEIFHSKELDQYFANAWEHVHLSENNLYEFDDDFHLLYLIAHIAKHIHFGGAGIRMYLDIALFIKQKGTDFNFQSLLDTAKTLGFDKFVCTVISAACSWFSLEIPMIVKNTHKITEDTLEQLFCFTIDKGIFGNAMTSSGEATVQIMKQSGKKYPKISALLTFAFPPFSIMKLKHTYLKKAPILLPFAWIQRAFSNIDKIKSKKQKVKDIVSTNKSSIEKQSQLLSDIGL